MTVDEQKWAVEEPRLTTEAQKLIAEELNLTAEKPRLTEDARKVDVRLPRKGNSSSHGARPVHLIITMIKWIRTRRLSIKRSLSL